MDEPSETDLSRDLAADLELFDWTPEDTHNALLVSWRAGLRRARRAEAEVRRLQGIIEGLADRVARQSDQLTRRAERDSPDPD